jgi:hypothetical protein
MPVLINPDYKRMPRCMHLAALAANRHNSTGLILQDDPAGHDPAGKTRLGLDKLVGEVWLKQQNREK